MTIKELIIDWVSNNYGRSEAEEPSWDIDALAKHIESKLAEKNSKLFEQLEEIQSICIGADSPDANTLGEQDPAKELQNCRADISAISNITEQLQQTLGE